LFKGYLNYSFRQILEKNIQPSFHDIHEVLYDSRMSNSTGKKLDEQQIEALDKEIDNLYKRIYEFNVALSKASSCDKVSAKTKISKRNF
jgi:Na+/phosphate symporter